MTQIHYKGAVYEPRNDETLLQMFLRRGVNVPYSCGGGSCHFCMHRCTSGDIPAASQKTLRQVHRDNGFFLLCCCTPSSDMTIELPRRNERFFQMEVMSNDDGGKGKALTLQPYVNVNVRAGQYFSLSKEGSMRVTAKVLEPMTNDGGILLGLPADSDFEAVVEEVLEALGPFNEPPPEVDMADGVRRAYPEPDPQLWDVLNREGLLRAILKAFYHRVFRDALLAPFFTSVTESRLVDKQYNFLCQAITGEKVYFGERPRNAHHWMVITDAIFDHRTDILRGVLEEFSVDAETTEKLIQVEEYYRQDIVKERPWEKVLFGKAIPVEGYESLVMDEASLCDACEAIIEKGETVTYHVRTGKVSCQNCRNP